MNPPPRVLIVEPDAATRSLLATVLTEAGYASIGAADGPAGLELAEREPPQLVVVNARLPVMDLHAFVAHVRSGPGPHPPLVVLSTDLELPVVTEAAAIVALPFDLDDLLTVVCRLAPPSGHGSREAVAPGADGRAKVDKDEARRQQQWRRLGQHVATLRGDLDANRDASRRLLVLGRPFTTDEVAQWRALGREAERLRSELALLYAEFETLRSGRAAPQ